VLAITLVALALRLVLGPWGPFHISGYAPLFVAGAARNPESIAAYGPGYAEVFGPIAALAPSDPDWAIFACNAILSALVAPVAFALARLAGVGRHAACAAALLLAVDPIAIRMGATESYFPIIILLCAGAAATVLVGASEREAGRRGRVAACLGAAALLLTQAARMHPSAWALAATVPFAAFAAPSARVPYRAFVFLASATLAGAAMLALSGGALVDVFGHLRGGTLMRPVPPGSVRPLIWIAAAAGAYVLVSPRRWLALPAALCAAALLMTRQSYWQGWFWQQSYDRLYLTLPVVAVVAAIPALVLRQPVVALLSALLLAVAWFHYGVPIITARTTDHREYRWVREELARLPAECRVIYVATVDKRSVLLPTYVGPPRGTVEMVAGEPHTIEAGLAPAPCAYYVRTSLCSSAEARPSCEAIERRLTLTPIARASFPAVPSSDLLSYDRDPVETLIARVDRVNR
jgi:hypothetical protein